MNNSQVYRAQQEQNALKEELAAIEAAIWTYENA